MEVKLVVPLWSVIVILVSFAGAFAVNQFMTRENSLKIKTLEGAISEEKARKIFVSKEIFENEMKHLNKNLDSIRVTNEAILKCVSRRTEDNA